MRARARAFAPELIAIGAGAMMRLAGMSTCFGVRVPPWVSLLTFVAVASLACALRDATPRRGARIAALFGVSMAASALTFVATPIVRFTEIPSIVAVALAALLAIAQSLPWALAGAGIALAMHRGVAAPSAFALGVGVATVAPALFPWTLATPLSRLPIAMQLAELVGERGVAVVLALVAALAVTSRRGAFAAVAVAVAVGVFGAIRIDKFRAIRDLSPSLRIGLVQPAVAPLDRWDPAHAASIVAQLHALTRRAQHDGAELAIWPESAFPFVLPRASGGPRRDVAAVRIRGAGISIPVLAGVLAEASPLGGDSDRVMYNAAVLVQRDGEIGDISAKIALLPFGEAVPFGEELPMLRRIFARGLGMRPGSAVHDLATRSPAGVATTFRILNCYEDVLPTVARRMDSAPAGLLVNITNDAWFDGTSEPELHLLASIARTIELRRDLVRAVNTGISAHISALGEIVATAPQSAATTLLVDARILSGPPTLYQRFGDWTWALVVAALALRPHKSREALSPR